MGNEKNRTLKRLVSVQKYLSKFLDKSGLRSKQRKEIEDAVRVYVLTQTMPEMKDVVCSAMADEIKNMCDHAITRYDKWIENSKKECVNGTRRGAPKGNQNACKNKSKTNQIQTENKSKSEKSHLNIYNIEYNNLNTEVFKYDEKEKINKKKNESDNTRVCATAIRENQKNCEVPLRLNSRQELVVDWIEMKKEILAFGKQMGYTEQECEKFCEYTHENWINKGCDEHPTTLLTSKGEIINNWKGAMVAFLRTNKTYNQQDWCIQHNKTFHPKRKNYKNYAEYKQALEKQKVADALRESHPGLTL